MKELEDSIRQDGIVREGNVLKVDSFLNHKCYVALYDQMGAEWARLFEGKQVDKILTIESSGIAVAVAAGMALGVPVVFAKKHKSSNVDGSIYATTIHSFTHGNDYRAVVSSDYLGRGDRVLLVDDFLANGSALRGLIDLVRQADAELCGAAVAIEKGFQSGGDELRREGVRIESLAVIESMSESEIVFRSTGSQSFQTV